MSFAKITKDNVTLVMQGSLPFDEEVFVSFSCKIGLQAIRCEQVLKLQVASLSYSTGAALTDLLMG